MLIMVFVADYLEQCYFQLLILMFIQVHYYLPLPASWFIIEIAKTIFTTLNSVHIKNRLNVHVTGCWCS
jgi:hypothetical protein